MERLARTRPDPTARVDAARGAQEACGSLLERASGEPQTSADARGPRTMISVRQSLPVILASLTLAAAPSHAVCPTLTVIQPNTAYALSSTPLRHAFDQERAYWAVIGLVGNNSTTDWDLEAYTTGSGS